MTSRLALAALIAASLVPAAAAETFTIEIGGSEADIEYSADGVSVIGADVNRSETSITLDVETDASSGTLTITLERGVLESQRDGVDTDYIVLADLYEADAVETQGPDGARILEISVPIGTVEIEIIGTAVGDGSSEASDDDGAAPADDPPIEDPPAESAPVEDPPVEDPPVETPPVESPDAGTRDDAGAPEDGSQDGTPVIPPVTEPREQPGTASSDACGPGTVLRDGVCVLDDAGGARGGSLLDASMGRDLIVAAVAVFVLALIILAILYAIGRAGRSRGDAAIRG